MRGEVGHQQVCHFVPYLAEDHFAASGLVRWPDPQQLVLSSLRSSYVSYSIKLPSNCFSILTIPANHPIDFPYKSSPSLPISPIKSISVIKSGFKHTTEESSRSRRPTPFFDTEKAI